MNFKTGQIPLTKAFVREEFLYDLDPKHTGKFIPCMIYGITSIKNRAPLFHCLLPNGASYWNLPVHAFSLKDNASPLSIQDSCFWDSFSYHFTVIRFDYLREMDCIVKLKHNKKANARYLFTIDWADPIGTIPSGHSEIPSEHKCGHVLALDSGQLVIYPNNRILWKESSFVTLDDNKIDYKINNKLWYGEGFNLDNNDDYFYTVNKRKEKKRD